MSKGNITSYGAAGEVTGSRHLFRAPGCLPVLLDCGLFQGKRQESYDKSRHFGFPVDEVGAVVLSHAHLDHCGALPRLLLEGFQGKIHATQATAEIANLILMDSAYLQVRDVEFVNKKHRRHGLPLHFPLYTPEDVPPVMDRFVIHEYEVPFDVVPGVRCTLYDAGHILGSSQVLLEYGDLEYPRRFLYSGDLGRAGLPILNDPVTPPCPDIVMMETTYGGRLHDPIDQVRNELTIELERLVANKGCMLIPAFSVERTQEILYELAMLRSQNRIPSIPLYVDSPLATSVTEIFKRHHDLVDPEFRELLKTSDPFAAVNLHFTHSVDESIALNDTQGPLIIISASGMCEGGRIVHHLRNRINRHDTTILIVGYMAQNTLGRKLADREPEVKIFGEVIHRNARVKILNNFSGHAGQDELLKYVAKMDGRLRKVLLIHGEQSQMLTFRELVQRERPTVQVSVNQEAVPVELI